MHQGHDTPSVIYKDGRIPPRGVSSYVLVLVNKQLRRAHGEASGGRPEGFDMKLLMPRSINRILGGPIVDGVVSSSIYSVRSGNLPGRTEQKKHLTWKRQQACPDGNVSNTYCIVSYRIISFRLRLLATRNRRIAQQDPSLYNSARIERHVRNEMLLPAAGSRSIYRGSNLSSWILISLNYLGCSPSAFISN